MTYDKKMIGRTYEALLLRNAINSTRAELGIIYGRRRVGKSYLKVCRGYTKQKQKQKQIDHFCKQLAEQTKTIQVKADSWEIALDAITQYISKGRHYVVFDELPWMSSEKQELVNILKYYWDNKWIMNKQLTLILCGPVAHFMEPA